MEGATHLWKAEPGGDRVQHAEGTVWWRPEVERAHATEERTADQGGPAQHRATQLPAVLSEVIYFTDPF